MALCHNMASNQYFMYTNYIEKMRSNQHRNHKQTIFKPSHFQHALCLLNILQYWKGVNAITFTIANQSVYHRSLSYIVFNANITLFQVTIDYKWISIIIYIEIKVILPFYAICIFYSVILWFKEVATFF